MTDSAADLPRDGATPFDVLRAIRSRQPPDPEIERCDMCATQIGDEHQHIVDLQSRALMCACRACYLLFTADGAQLRYRAVPDRYLSFPPTAVDQWDALQIPVGLAFLFHNSVQGTTGAFYPGPAGVTESELPLDAWQTLRDSHPGFDLLEPDVEALLVQTAGGQPRCYLVPIDACYELAGRLRAVWRGFDGGQEARRQIAEFFEQIDRRSRPAPSMPALEGRDV